MDTAQAEGFADLMARRREDIGSRVEDLTGQVRALDTMWIGPDADGFRERWDALCAGPVQQVLDSLLARARDLYEEAQEQDAASTAGMLGAIGEWLEDIFRGGDFSWSSLLPNPNDWEDWLGTGIAAVLDGVGGAMTGLATYFTNPRTVATLFLAGGDDLLDAGRGIAGAASKVSRFLGPVGAVLTAGFAGWDRWEQDASDPSLSTGERITRAVVDGGANAGGAALGAWGGAAGGAAIGTLICPGVGTVIGGAIGGIVGGLAGGSAANGIVDWVLG